MNDLSVIIQKLNNGDSLNQTNIELIKKLQSQNNSRDEKKSGGRCSESDTSINKMGNLTAEESFLKPAAQKMRAVPREEENSDANYKMEVFDIHSSHSNNNIYNKEDQL